MERASDVRVCVCTSNACGSIHSEATYQGRRRQQKVLIPVTWRHGEPRPGTRQIYENEVSLCFDHSS